MRASIFDKLEIHELKRYFDDAGSDIQIKPKGYFEKLDKALYEAFQKEHSYQQNNQ